MSVHACIKGLDGYTYDTSLSLGGALMTVFSLCFSVVHKISVIKMNNFFDWGKTCEVSKLSILGCSYNSCAFCSFATKGYLAILYVNSVIRKFWPSVFFFLWS